MNKRGRISKDEDKKIRNFLSKEVPINEIATKLKRPLKQIEDYVRKFYGKGVDIPDNAEEIAEFTRQLRNTVYWKELQRHYNKEELEYYETIYASLMVQFKEDVTSVDDLQILQAIDAHMLINMHKRKTRMINDRILLIEREINTILLEDDDDPESKKRRIALENEKISLIAQSNNGAKVFTELSKKFDNTVEKLKSTRDQRLRTAENSHQSWPALIKHMQEKKVREAQGKYAEMVKFSTDKALAELQEPHRYVNDQIDQPMLLPERVLIEMPKEEEDGDEIHSD